MSVAAQVECQWKVLWRPATERDSHAAKRRCQTSRLTGAGASRFDGPMMGNELQVGTVCPWRRREDAILHAAVGAGFHQVSCPTIMPPTC
jgi:hypothetical protein